MTNQIQNNGGKENDTPKKTGNGEMNDEPAFVVQGTSSSHLNNKPEHLIQNHDKHQKQQAQQQQEHQQKQAIKNTEKTGGAQQGDASLEQRKQQQQDDKHQQLDQQDHLTKDQGKMKKNQNEQQTNQEQPKQQQQAQPQQYQSSPTVDNFKGKWEQQVGAAKVVWGKLTDDELLQSEGHVQKLAGLVQERYAISRAEADKQVKAFIEKCKC